jgi:hypothetical protein
VLLAVWAKQAADAGRAKAARELGEQLNTDPVADLLHAFACAETEDRSECPSPLVVAEKELDAYLAAHPAPGHRVVRIGALEADGQLYQVAASVHLIDSTVTPMKRKAVAVNYTDRDATPESTKATYKESLAEIVQMAELGLRFDSVMGAAPTEWASLPTLKDVKAKGQARCVKNAPAKVLVHDTGTRAWTARMYAGTIQLFSGKWIVC